MKSKLVKWLVGQGLTRERAVELADDLVAEFEVTARTDETAAKPPNS